MTPKEIAKEWRRMRIGVETSCWDSDQRLPDGDRRAADLHRFIAEHEDEILAALEGSEPTGVYVGFLAGPTIDLERDLAPGESCRADVKAGGWRIYETLKGERRP